MHSWSRFSSSVLVEIAKGIEGLVRNNGRINLITSPNLSQEDIDAIRSGYKNREEIIKRALIGSLVEPENKYQEEKLNLLANLIADGHLDIKIAVTANDSLYGMYHEKVGIIEDNFGEKVAFSGSLNETENAFTANFETIDVYCNWRGNEDKQRVESKEATFEKIWNDRHNNIKTFEFKELTDKLIEKYKKSAVDYSKLKDLDNKSIISTTNNTFFAVPEDINFYDYQKEAIDNWEKHKDLMISF